MREKINTTELDTSFRDARMNNPQDKPSTEEQVGKLPLDYSAKENDRLLKGSGENWPTVESLTIRELVGALRLRNLNRKNSKPNLDSVIAARLEALQQRNEKALSLIDSHGHHHKDCDVIKQKFKQTRCDCGFSETLKALTSEAGA